MSVDLGKVEARKKRFFEGMSFTASSDRLEALLTDAGVTPKIVYRSSSFELVRSLSVLRQGLRRKRSKI